MDSPGFLFNLIVYLAAAVIIVPLSARLGLGSVLGYLAAGICIGPWGLKLIDNVQDILHFAEFGVVLLLFLIGLELQSSKLWGMRRAIVAAGGVQLVITSALIFLIAYFLLQDWATALIIGLGLSLSSTAIVLQTLNERHLLTTPLGHTSFAILLFQDISVIPIIALIPLLASEAVAAGDGVSAVLIIAVMGGIFVVGRYALRHIFRFVAAAHLPEVFTALSLLLVSGIAAIMNLLGVSMALGAFLAGVILADSEYRHALESDIQPFKGLLLGLFFISVGMSIDFALLWGAPWLMAGLTLGLIAVKALVLWGIARFSNLDSHHRSLFAAMLSQSGEFSFVLFGFAVTAKAMDTALADQLILVAAMSMVVTPLLMVAHDRFLAPRPTQPAPHASEPPPVEANAVILIGFGRFGQVIGRMLLASKITPTVIDYDPNHIERVRRFGYKAYYGDGRRLEVLQSVGLERARLVILAADTREAVDQTVAILQKHYPQVPIIARAHDRNHAMYLVDHDVRGVVRETFYSAVEMGKQTLEMLGTAPPTVEKLVTTYVRHDVDTLYRQVTSRDDEKALISISNSAREQLEQILEADQQQAADGDAAEHKPNTPTHS